MTTDNKYSNEHEQQDRTPKKEVRRIPWWVSIVCAIGTYCSLKYIVPEIQTTNETLSNLFEMGPIAAPVLTIPLLLLAAKQLYDTDLPEENREENDQTEN